MMTSNYLFIYGTLLDDDNEYAIYLKNNCSFYANGRFEGRLYNIGEYPGAVADKNGGHVYGSIYLMNNEDVLKQLDDYEGFGEGQDEPNLFVRRIVKVETDKQEIDCCCYLFNLPVENLAIISSGDYLKFKPG